jgi:hypothetical protein
MDAGLGLNGIIYEIFYFNVALSPTDRQSIEGYLAQKWNLTSDLPAGHPGLTTDYTNHRLPDTNTITFNQKPGLQYHTSIIFPTYPPIIHNIVTANLLLHLDAGNPASYSSGSPTVWNDLAGSGLTTTLYGGPTYSSANGGYLMFSPSSSQYGQTSASLSELATFTVEVWHYFDNTHSGNAPCILSEIWQGTPINFIIGCQNGWPYLTTGFYGAGGWNVTNTDYQLPSVGWYHIVGTFDGSNIKLYINGALTRTQASSNTPTQSGLGIHIMRRWDQNPPEDYWGGGLAVLRIYSVALSGDQVVQNYGDGKSRFGLS